MSGILSGILAAAGQTCIAGSRALIHRSIYNEVIEAVRARAETIVIGNPLADDTEMGPIANEPQLGKVEQYVQIAREEELGDGYFYEPTIVADVDPSMRIYHEEVFGPLLTVTAFDTDEEAVQLANTTDYGLAAGIWTREVGRARTIAKALQAGTVWVNTHRAVAHNMPFGGYKKSGLGRENGAAAIEDYLQSKAVWVETAPSTGDPFALKV